MEEAKVSEEVREDRANALAAFNTYRMNFVADGAIPMHHLNARLMLTSSGNMPRNLTQQRGSRHCFILIGKRASTEAAQHEPNPHFTLPTPPLPTNVAAFMKYVRRHIHTNPDLTAAIKRIAPVSRSVEKIVIITDGTEGSTQAAIQLVGAVVCTHNNNDLSNREVKNVGSYFSSFLKQLLRSPPHHGCWCGRL